MTPVPFHVARDPVSLPVLRRWCDALSVSNPVYTDPAVAVRTQFGHIVAPLAMLDVWTKPGLAYHRNIDDPQGAAFQSLDNEGFTSAVAVSSELVQHRPLTLGETVSSTIAVEAVTPEKATAVGPGRFVTTRQDLYVEGDPVGLSRFTVMKFRPTGDKRQGSPRPAAQTTSADRPVTPRRDGTGTVMAAALEPSLSLLEVAVQVTPTLIVSGALMTSDYFEVHHDRESAIAKGSRDIFMNIHTTLGLLQRCVGDWLGPDALWRSMSVRLGVPNYPGDVMVVTARPLSVDQATGEVRIQVSADNSLGSHAEGRVEVVLPV